MILLVDSDEIWQAIISRHLQAAQMSYTICDTGSSAMKFLEKSTPEMIVMDLDLPDVKGTVFLKKIRQDGLLYDLPVLILTNRDDRESVADSLEYGASDYILKSDTGFYNLISKINIFKR